MKGTSLIVIIALLVIGFMAWKGYNGLIVEDENVIKPGIMYRVNTKNVTIW